MMYTKTLQLAQHIQEYLLDLESNTNHILQFNSEMDVTGLLKTMDVKIEDYTEKFFERYKECNRGIVRKSVCFY